MADTHINAYYTELTQAENELAIAKGKVESIKEKIVELGGKVPGAKSDFSERMKSAREKKAQAKK